MSTPEHPLALIIFAHGSGSSRFSPRNNYVARYLNQANFATLLLDLLSPSEDQALENRFNIGLLGERLAASALWAMQAETTKTFPIGLFGASTGAAAALTLAGDQHSLVREKIYAVVSRGGRPDLTPKTNLGNVLAPTLLIVGQNDGVVIAYNEAALDQLKSVKAMKIIKGATHLFEEPGALEQVAELAGEWFKYHLDQSNGAKHE